MNSHTVIDIEAMILIIINIIQFVLLHWPVNFQNSKKRENLEILHLEGAIEKQNQEIEFLKVQIYQLKKKASPKGGYKARRKK